MHPFKVLKHNFSFTLVPVPNKVGDIITLVCNFNYKNLKNSPNVAKQIQETLPFKIVEWRSALAIALSIWTSAWTVVADKTILLRSVEVCKIHQQDNPH